MKVRIGSQQLRFRVDADTLERLLDGAVIRTEVVFAPETSLVCTAARKDSLSDPMHLEYEDGHIRLWVRGSELVNLAGRVPSRSGIEWTSPSGISVGFEVDVRRTPR